MTKNTTAALAARRAKAAAAGMSLREFTFRNAERDPLDFSAFLDRLPAAQFRAVKRAVLEYLDARRTYPDEATFESIMRGYGESQHGVHLGALAVLS